MRQQSNVCVLCVILMLHRYAFNDTDYLTIPITGIPILTDILQNRGGGKENHLKFMCIIAFVIIII